MCWASPAARPRVQYPSISFETGQESDGEIESLAQMVRETPQLQSLTLRHPLPETPTADALIDALAQHAAIRQLEIACATPANICRLATRLIAGRPRSLSSVSLAGVGELPRDAVYKLVALITAGALATLTLKLELSDAHLRLLVDAARQHPHTQVVVEPAPMGSPERFSRMVEVIQAEQQVDTCTRLLIEVHSLLEQWRTAFDPATWHDEMPLLPHELSGRALAFQFHADLLEQRLLALRSVPAGFEHLVEGMLQHCRQLKTDADRFRRRDMAFKLASLDPSLT